MQPTRRVTAVAETGRVFPRPADRSSAQERAPEGAASRALVVVAAEAVAGGEPAARGRRAFAPFLAHLIATRQQFPQWRERRRADAAWGAARYAAGAKGAAPARPRLNRSV